MTQTAFPSSPPPAPYPTTERQAQIIELADRMAAIAAANAGRHDRENTFPFDTYEALRESGYLALAVPEAFGGFGASPLELMLGQQRLAWGDGSVALSSTMHHLQTAGVASNTKWPPELRERVLRDIAENGALINSIASEPALGSPSRGGLYQTTATREGDHWVIDGRKTFSTLSPALTWGVLLLTVIDGEQEPARGTFLVEMNSPGVQVTETWDTMAMRATGSHDVIFDHVIVPEGNRLPQAPGLRAGDLGPWNLIGSARCFWGLRQRPGISRSISPETANRPQCRAKRLPNCRPCSIAWPRWTWHCWKRIRCSYGTAELAERLPDERKSFGWRFAAANMCPPLTPLPVTDQAMRVVGSVGLSGPIHWNAISAMCAPGSAIADDDVTLTTIGKNALGVEVAPVVPTYPVVPPYPSSRPSPSSRPKWRDLSLPESMFPERGF